MQPVIGIVEDDDAICHLLRDVFATEGFRTRCYRTSVGAGEIVRRGLPALLLVDIWSAHPDAGLRVLAEVRAHPWAARIPLAIMSADRRFLIQQGARLHAAGIGVVAKPFDLDELLHEVGQRMAPMRDNTALQRSCAFSPSS